MTRGHKSAADVYDTRETRLAGAVWQLGWQRDVLYMALFYNTIVPLH